MNGKSKPEGSTPPEQSAAPVQSAIDSATEQIGEFQAGGKHDSFLRTASESGAVIVRVAASAGRRP